MDQAEQTSQISPRAVLGQLAYQLRGYIEQQRGQGLDGVVTASAEDIAQWEALLSRAQARRVEALRARLSDGPPTSSPLRSQPAPQAAPARFDQDDPGEQVERSAPAGIAAQIDAASTSARSKALPSIASAADEPAPWKSIGRRPQLLVDPDAAPAPKRAAAPTPSPPAPKATPQPPAQPSQPAPRQAAPTPAPAATPQPPRQARPSRDAIPERPRQPMGASTPQVTPMVEDDHSATQPVQIARDGELFGASAVETIRGFNDTDDLQKRLDQMSRREKMGFLRECLGDCQRCALSQSRKNIVFGDGSPNAELVFVGEAPGYHEDKQGIPFVGDSGNLLNKMIEAMGLQRETVYICNVLKCRPPNNRNPAPDEIQRCSPFLYKQLEAISPRAIVTLGRFASQSLLQTEMSMGKMRGRWHDWRGVPVMPTFHPAYLLRTPEDKRLAWEDLQKVMNIMGLQPRR